MSRHQPAIVVIVLALVLALGVASRAAADGFALICNAKASATRLSVSEVRSLYTGKTKTLGGSAVVVVVRSEDDVAFGLFVDHVFSIPTKALLSKIKQEVFKGEMTKPLKANTDGEVVQHVTASPGNIGVISAAGVNQLPKTVTVIAIGG